MCSKQVVKVILFDGVVVIFNVLFLLLLVEEVIIDWFVVLC